MLGALAAASLASGDSLVGKDAILCAPGYFTHCSSGGVCETRPADNYGIPNFLRFDLERGLLLTSEASDEDASSPIQSISRTNGEIYLQGVEAGRVFSVVIVEALGTGSMAIIASGETATAFLACTVI
jgi:hypothetical protein